ncbi:MAG: SDR family oxidoreductase [Gammaproteobacteria bacterium]
MSRLAFVTGASGFVGAHLCRQLLDQGWRVRVLLRPTSRRDDLAGLEIEPREGDVTDPASLAAALSGGADAVFHVAASTSIWSRERDLQTRINVDGTRHVIEAAVAAGVPRLVHTSSFAVWGFRHDLITEESPWVEEGGWINYVRTKRRAEELVRAATGEGRLEAVICNPAHILGPGDRHNWSRMIRMVDTGKLPGVPPGGGAFADVREVARAHVAAFERGRNGASYLLGGEDTTFLEVIRMVGDILGKPVPRRASPAWLLRAAGRVQAAVAAVTGRAPDVTPEGAAMITRHLACDSSRAVDELGYRVTPVRALLEDTCAWMRREGLRTGHRARRHPRLPGRTRTGTAQRQKPPRTRTSARRSSPPCRRRTGP